MDRKERIRRILGSDTDSELGDAFCELGYKMYQSESKGAKTQASYEDAIFLMELTTSFIIYLSRFRKPK